MKRRWFLGSVMLLLVALLVAGCGVSQEDYDTLSETLNLEAACVNLRNSAQIKWFRVLEAVQKIEREPYYPEATSAENAYERLDAFIADMEALVAIEEQLSNQVPAEYGHVYQQSASLDRSRLKEAAALREEVQGRMLANTVSYEYEQAYQQYRRSGELFTEQQKEAWLSSLDQALEHYRAEIRLLNEAIDIAPELTRYLDQKIEYAESYQRSLSYLENRIEEFPPVTPMPVPVPPPPPE